MRSFKNMPGYRFASTFLRERTIHFAPARVGFTPFSRTSPKISLVIGLSLLLAACLRGPTPQIAPGDARKPAAVGGYYYAGISSQAPERWYEVTPRVDDSYSVITTTRAIGKPAKRGKPSRAWLLDGPTAKDFVLVRALEAKSGEIEKTADFLIFTPKQDGTFSTRQVIPKSTLINKKHRNQTLERLLATHGLTIAITSSGATLSGDLTSRTLTRLFSDPAFISEVKLAHNTNYKRVTKQDIPAPDTLSAAAKRTTRPAAKAAPTPNPRPSSTAKTQSGQPAVAKGKWPRILPEVFDPDTAPWKALTPGVLATKKRAVMAGLETSGDGEDAVALAKDLYLGQVVEQDLDTAVKLLIGAAKQGRNPEANFILGNITFAGFGKKGLLRNTPAAFAWWRNAEDLGHMGATALLGRAIELGISYNKGKRLKIDIPAALARYYKSAKASDPIGLYHVGRVLEFAIGVKKDVGKAIALYQKAAGLGQRDASFRLGEIYSKGQGLPKSPRKAVNHFAAAAKHGHGGAQFELGKRYAEGDGVKRNDLLAALWLRVSCQNPYEHSDKSEWGGYPNVIKGGTNPYCHREKKIRENLSMATLFGLDEAVSRCLGTNYGDCGFSDAESAEAFKFPKFKMSPVKTPGSTAPSTTEPAEPKPKPKPRAAKAKPKPSQPVKTLGIKQCGNVFYYEDGNILRENASKGCRNLRYGAVFGYTASKTAPDAGKSTIKELVTVCVPNGVGKPIVISRGRDIPLRDLKPKRYLWGDYVVRGGRKIACKNYRYKPR